MGPIGFVITIGTLVATFNQARKAKNSADAARDAAKEATERVRRSIVRVDTARTLEAAVATINRIYDLQRRREWDLVPEFYKNVRDLLAEVQGEASALTVEEKDYVLGTASELARIEQDVTRRFGDGLTADDVAEMNQVITRHSSKLITIKTDLGRREEA